MKEQSSDVLLSVVIVILGGRFYLPRCLGYLLPQQGSSRAEIIVPCDESITDVDSLKLEFPSVQFLSLQGKLTYGQLRSAGFRQASGPVIALTEDHCMPAPDWCSRILEQHEKQNAAAGGAVDKGFPMGSLADSILNWAIYLSDFSRYANPVREGASGYLTDCNVSYKREPLQAIYELWKEEFHETRVNWELLRRGETLYLSRAIVVHQQRNLNWLFAIHERFSFGRLFGWTRVSAVSFPRRIAYAAASFLLPPLFLLRVLNNVIRKKRYRNQTILALPAILILGSVWAFGEFVAYLTARPEGQRLSK